MTRNLYALLVGIDDYAPPIPALQGCKHDINAIEAYLQKQIGGAWTLKQPRKLLDQQATRQAIIDGFQQYLTQADREDIALFYYAGHGGQEQAPVELRHLEPDGLDETLVCYDSRFPGNHDLADKELRYLLTQVAKNNSRIIVILDCCHSGSGTRNIPQGVRLAPEDTRERDLSSFIFVEDATFNYFLSTSQQGDEKKIGLNLPQGRHILLAACRDYQYAGEYRGEDGITRGAFSYFLLKSLEQAHGSLSYLDLARNVEALIRGKVREQVPQLEANHPEDLKELFLDQAIADRQNYLILSYGDQRSDRGWQIDGGAIQGIAKSSSTEETTLLAIFPVASKPEELTQLDQALASARVTKVFTQNSKVEITQGKENLHQNCSYWAIITSLPLEPLKVFIEDKLGKEPGKSWATAAIAKANLMQKSPYLQQVENATDADLNLLVRDGQYLIVQDERPLIAPINEMGKGIKALEAIARWRSILNLKNPNRSTIKSQDVEMEIKLIGYQRADEEIAPLENVDTLTVAATVAAELRLEYQYKAGEWKKPVIQINLINHSRQKLYANVIDLAEDYSVTPILFEDGIEIRSSVVLRGKTSESAGIFTNDALTFSIPPEFLAPGITEYQDILKLIVSKTDFNASLLEQEGFEPPNRETRSTARLSSLDRLMDRIYSRKLTPAGRRCDDWITQEVAVTIAIDRSSLNKS